MYLLTMTKTTTLTLMSILLTLMWYLLVSADWIFQRIKLLDPEVTSVTSVLRTEMQVNFVQHMKTEHDRCQLRCTLCPKEFSSPNRLFKHKRSHECLKYYCEYYTYICHFPYKIQAHKNTHTQEELFGCKECNRTFSSKPALKQHVSKPHSLYSVSTVPWDKLQEIQIHWSL